MSDSIKIEMDCSSPEQTEVTANSVEDLIPPKSRKVYDFTYRRFLKWAEQQKASHYSENVLLTYFNHLSNNEHLKSSTLWSHYSMLKAELNINHNIRLGKYTKLLAFLKRKNAGYKPKKTKILSKQQVDNFLHNAPNEKYLATKVILILGVTGGCRCDEITSLTMGDIEDLGSAILIKLQDTRNYKSRSFIIVEKFYLEICRKYISVRKDIKISRFLLKYHNGKCANMVMGKHKIGSAPREIASFLKLPNYHEYTGHCLRRTSATLLVDNGDISALERHKGWRSMPVTESCRKDSIENREQTVLKVLTPLDINKPSTSNNLNSVVDITIKIESDSDDTDKRELGTTSAVKIENFGEYKLGPLIVEGKTKQVYELPGSPDLCILLNTDRITAGDGVKAHDLAGKAALSNKTNRKVFEILNAVGVKTSFVKPATDVAFVSKRCKMIPIEWVTRGWRLDRSCGGIPGSQRVIASTHQSTRLSSKMVQIKTPNGPPSR
jgi:integrase